MLVSEQPLQTVFTALILARITYAISVWGGHLTGQQRQRINAFLKRSQKFEFTESLYRIEELLKKSDTKLFGRLTNPAHCFILSYLVTINLMSFFWEKEGIHLPSPTVLIICIKTPFSPVVFLGSYNFCDVVLYIICHDVLTNSYALLTFDELQ